VWYNTYILRCGTEKVLRFVLTGSPISLTFWRYRFAFRQVFRARLGYSMLAYCRCDRYTVWVVVSVSVMVWPHGFCPSKPHGILPSDRYRCR